MKASPEISATTRISRTIDRESSRRLVPGEEVGRPERGGWAPGGPGTPATGAALCSAGALGVDGGGVSRAVGRGAGPLWAGEERRVVGASVGGVVCWEDWGWEAAFVPGQTRRPFLRSVLTLGRSRGLVICGVAGRGGRGVRGGGGAPRGRLSGGPLLVRSAFAAVGWWERCVRRWGAWAGSPGAQMGHRRGGAGMLLSWWEVGGAPGVGVRRRAVLGSPRVASATPTTRAGSWAHLDLAGSCGRGGPPQRSSCASLFGGVWGGLWVRSGGGR